MWAKLYAMGACKVDRGVGEMKHKTGLRNVLGKPDGELSVGRIQIGWDDSTNNNITWVVRMGRDWMWLRIMSSVGRWY
jgi:hypothetical protein